MPSSLRGSNPAVVHLCDPRTRLSVLPQARWWGLWAAGLAVVVLVLGLCVTTWMPGLSRGELGVDQQLSRHHDGFLTAVAMTINYVFAPAVGVPVVLLLGLFLMARKAPVNAIAVMTVASLGWVASEVFKIIIARPRPDQSQLFDPLSPETGSNSFPSGHAAFAVALAFAVYFLARGSRWARTAAIVGALVAVIVAWSRVYVGVHYPSDVIASFFASTAAVILFAGLWNRYAARILIRVPWLTRIGPVPRTSTSV